MDDVITEEGTVITAKKAIAKDCGGEQLNTITIDERRENNG